jgi:hypothetical protein
MSAGRIIVLVLGIASLVLALVYLVSPETIGGPLTAGELAPQAGMPGNPVSYQFTKIPLGVIDLVVPVFSAVLIFGLLGLALLGVGLFPAKKGVVEHG